MKYKWLQKMLATVLAGTLLLSGCGTADDTKGNDQADVSQKS